MEVINAIGDLVQKYGLFTVVVIVCLLIALGISRAWAKAKDTRTEKEDNYNKANDLILNKFIEQDKELTSLRTDVTGDHETINRLEGALQDALRQIDELQKTVVRLQSDKDAIAGERDKVRADLDKANESIRELEQRAANLEGQLTAARELQATVIKPLIDAVRLSVPMAAVVLADTGALNPAHVPDGDPAAAAPTTLEA